MEQSHRDMGGKVNSPPRRRRRRCGCLAVAVAAAVAVALAVAVAVAVLVVIPEGRPTVALVVVFSHPSTPGRLGAGKSLP
jgi:hypothetical protein